MSDEKYYLVVNYLYTVNKDLEFIKKKIEGLSKYLPGTITVDSNYKYIIWDISRTFTTMYDTIFDCMGAINTNRQSVNSHTLLTIKQAYVTALHYLRDIKISKLLKSIKFENADNAC